LAGLKGTDGFGVGVGLGVSIVVGSGVGTGVKGMLGIVGDSVIGAAAGLTQLVVNKRRSISARSLALNIPLISYPRVTVFHLHYGTNS
jgi:hypothetical protein